MNVRKILSGDGKVSYLEEPNPAYEVWMQKDQALVAYITTTLSDRVLQSVSDDLMAAELCNNLAHTYSQASEARILQLKWQFQSMRKGNKSINDFIVDMRHVTHQLAAIGSSISDKEMVQQVLGSLGPEYQIFRNTMQVLPSLSTFEDLKAKFMK
ncbi:unnamed protein product [Victoria cruziana]